MTSNERKLRTAVGRAVSDLEKASLLIGKKWGAIPYESRNLFDPLLAADKLIYRSIKRLKKAKNGTLLLPPKTSPD